MMTNRTSWNAGVYLLIGLVWTTAGWAAGAIATGTVDWFDPLVHPSLAQYQPLAIALLGFLIPMLSGWMVAHRPRIGSEKLSASVDALKATGVDKKDMVVKERRTGRADPRGVG